MSKIYLLTVAYQVDPNKKREESVKISFMWVPAFPSKPYVIGDDKVLHGQPFTIYVTKGSKKIVLYLGENSSGKKNEESTKPTKILKAFAIEKSTPLNPELAIQFLQNPDGSLDVKILNDDVEITVLGKIEKDGIKPPELPAELPRVPEPRFDPIDLIWVFDGTLAESVFQKCKNTAVLLTDKLRFKTNLKVGYYCFGEYEDVFRISKYPIPPDIYPLQSCTLTENLEMFKLGIRSLEPFPAFIQDDPASCLELALKKLADELEISPTPPNRSVWVFLMGNSLPHYQIDEIFEKKIHILPTEEFDNIYWKDEVARLRRIKNIHIHPIWVSDASTEKKWAETAPDGKKIGLMEARSWWKNSLAENGHILSISNETSPSWMSSNLYDLIWQTQPPKMETKEPSVFPLWRPLEELEIYVD